MKINVTDFVDGYNGVVGLFVTILTAIFGTYWYLFAGFLLLNVLDWLTGWYKARKLHRESSKKGAAGAIKKVGYWVVIAVSFLMPFIFVELGQDLLGIDLGFLELLGYFTLASLSINEIRSIVENLVECGYYIPEFLIKGLSITEKLLNSKLDVEE